MSATTGRQGPPRGGRIGQAAAAMAPVFRAMLDAIVLIVIFLLAEKLFFGSGFYAGLDFHPFWVVVLLTTLQNGLYAGVIAAFFSTLAMEWPARAIGVDIVEHYIQVSILPLQWLLTALLLGAFRGAELRDQAWLKKELRSAEKDKRRLAEELRLTDASLEEVQIEVLTRSGLSPNLVAQTLFKLGSDQVGADFEGAFDAACRLLAQDPCLLVLRRNDRFEVVAGDGTSRELFAAAIPGNKHFDEAVARSVPSVLDSAEVKRGTFGALALSPIRDDTGEPLGAVVILAENADRAAQAMLPASILAGIVKHRFETGQVP